MKSSNQVRCHPSWTQIGPKTYRQPYGFQEVLYNAISVPAGSPGLFLIGSSVTFTHIPASPDHKLSPSDLATLLRNGWLRLRRQYPALAAENLKEGKTYVSPSSPAELEDWLASTFIVMPGRTYSEHWKSLVKTRQMTLFYFPEERQLFLQGEHHILDGRGLMNFWDRYFKAVTAPEKGDLLKADGSEVSLLPPRSDDLLDITENSPGRGEQRALEILSPVAAIRDPICIPAAQPLPPCSPRNALLELRFSARTTESIVAACKAQRLSVTAVWHTAVILATQTVQAQRNAASGAGPGAGTQFACFGNFDLRRYFPAPETTGVPDAYSLSNHHGVLPYVVETSGKSFAQMVRELAAFYTQDMADPDVWSALGPMIRMMVPDFIKGQLDETAPALSSMGVVDNFIKHAYADAGGKGTWQIDEVWIGDTVTGPWLEHFMWAWRGRLSVNTCYNPAYYTHSEVDEFNQLVQEMMLEGLGVVSRGTRGKL
ncbi:hypothetical protein F4778DRAFT_792595 [Xylariomycetidae sp. FL2044]|nr:hypothetical protein F4778DRAFT_792595 [Xylariomycetidae sp. FL2044]